MLMLKQDITKKDQLNKLLKLLGQKLKINDDKDYEVVPICNNQIYANETIDQLPQLYYPVFYKDYAKIKNRWELALAIMHL